VKPNLLLLLLLATPLEALPHIVAFTSPSGFGEPRTCDNKVTLGKQLDSLRFYLDGWMGVADDRMGKNDAMRCRLERVEAKDVRHSGWNRRGF